MANGVNTQWFDLQVKHGNYLPMEKQESLTQIQMKQQEKYEQSKTIPNVINSKFTQQQLDQIEDDLDMDDEFTRQYMAKRYQQIKTRAENNKYGEVIEITRNQYVKEVSEADPTSFVVLHLYQNHIQFCELLNRALVDMAKTCPLVKFVRIVATKCIDNFPDKNCPWKLVSHNLNVDKILKHDVNNLLIFLVEQGVIPISKTQ